MSTKDLTVKFNRLTTRIVELTPVMYCVNKIKHTLNEEKDVKLVFLFFLFISTCILSRFVSPTLEVVAAVGLRTISLQNVHESQGRTLP